MAQIRTRPASSSAAESIRVPPDQTVAQDTKVTTDIQKMLPDFRDRPHGYTDDAKVAFYSKLH
jgi:hypothetical protein